MISCIFLTKSFLPAFLLFVICYCVCCVQCMHPCTCMQRPHQDTECLLLWMFFLLPSDRVSYWISNSLFWLGWLSSEPRNPAEVTGHVTAGTFSHVWLLHGCWSVSPGSHVCRASVVTGPLLSLILTFFPMWMTIVWQCWLFRSFSYLYCSKQCSLNSHGN